MSDIFLRNFPTDIERQKRVGHFFEKSLLPSLSKSDSNFFDLEIGCGHGHWLTEYSTSNQQLLCVGIDLITKRITKATAKKEKRNLDNLFFYKAEAQEFVSLIPKPIQIRNTFIMFPDPWPKKRHHKRRLIQQNFLSLLHSRTIESGTFFFRTDHEPYFEWTLEEISQSSFWETSEIPFPLEHNSYFQELLPEFKTTCASPVH